MRTKWIPQHSTSCLVNEGEFADAVHLFCSRDPSSKVGTDRLRNFPPPYCFFQEMGHQDYETEKGWWPTVAQMGFVATLTLEVVGVHATSLKVCTGHSDPIELANARLSPILTGLFCQRSFREGCPSARRSNSHLCLILRESAIPVHQRGGSYPHVFTPPEFFPIRLDTVCPT